jgi:hypothetical protein
MVDLWRVERQSEAVPFGLSGPVEFRSRPNIGAAEGS